jgi:antitoxin (DNA-binding transcriptional repressor) of toxin-antitoxin stability system
MKITATRLRQDIYSILDQVAETGVPVEIERKGRTLRIVADQKPSKLARLKKRDVVIGDFNDLIHMDWSKEWSELK